jgi:hypothetical protein
MVLSLFFYGSAWAAQSTADIPVTGELMKAAREKVMGKTAGASSTEQYMIGHGDILSIQVYP